MARKERIDQETYNKAKFLLGVPLERPSLEIGAAISCAFDMGYRTPERIAEMARKLISDQATVEYQQQTITAESK